jgi:hypothetical protein
MSPATSLPQTPERVLERRLVDRNERSERSRDEQACRRGAIARDLIPVIGRRRVLRSRVALVQEPTCSFRLGLSRMSAGAALARDPRPAVVACYAVSTSREGATNNILRLVSPLTIAECLGRLEASTGPLWRYAPLLSLLQEQNVLMAGRGTRLLASRRAIASSRMLVALSLRPSDDGGAILELSAAFDPVIPISAVIPPTALLGVVGLLSLDHGLRKLSFVHHGLGYSLVFLAFCLLLLALVMREPPRAAESTPPDDEVVDFLRRQLDAVDWCATR